MMQNIACFSPQCGNAVIGQCAGYGGPCGRFYCGSHSKDGLCEQCAEKKRQADAEQQENEMIQRIFEDYVQTAEKIPRMGCGQWIVAGVLMSIVFLVVSAVVDPMETGFGMLVGGIVMWAGFFAYGIPMSKRRDRMLKESEKTRPGFGEFYKIWENDRNKAEFKSAVIFSLSSSQTLIDMAQRERYSRTLADVRDIARNTEQMVRKIK